MVRKVSLEFIFFFYCCFGQITTFISSYKKRNDEKTPGKLSDTNDEGDSSANKLRKVRTKKTCWSTDPQQENQQETQDSINRHRRGKGSIAKSLHYGIESNAAEAPSIPLYRLVALI